MIPAIFHNLPKSAQQLALGTGAVVASLAGLHVSADLGLVPHGWKPSPQVWVIASIAGVAGVAAIACSAQQEPQQEGVTLPQLHSPAYVRRSPSTANSGAYEQLTAAAVDHALSFRPGTPEFSEAMRDGLGLLGHARSVLKGQGETEEWRSTAVSSAGAYGAQHLLTGEDDDLQNGYGAAENYPVLPTSASSSAAVDHIGSEDIDGDAWEEYEPEAEPLPELEPKPENEPESQPKVMRLSVLQAAASSDHSSHVA